MFAVEGRIVFKPERLSVVASGSRAQGTILVGLRCPDGRSPDGLWLELGILDAITLWQQLTEAIRNTMPTFQEALDFEARRRREANGFAEHSGRLALVVQAHGWEDGNDDAAEVPLRAGPLPGRRQRHPQGQDRSAGCAAGGG